MNKKQKAIQSAEKLDRYISQYVSRDWNVQEALKPTGVKLLNRLMDDVLALKEVEDE